MEPVTVFYPEKRWREANADNLNWKKRCVTRPMVTGWHIVGTAILADLLDVYLKWPNVEAVTQLVDYYLLEKDLEPNNVIVLSIDNYFAEPPATADARVMLRALANIKTTTDRPMWQQKVKNWADHLVRAGEASKPKKAGN